MREDFRIFLTHLLKIVGRRWLPRAVSRIAKSLIKKAVKYGPLRKDGYTQSLYGVWLKDQWADATFRFCATASYGFFYSNWIENTNGSIFIDVGSNQGLYSLIAAKNPAITSVYAFEPQPNIFENFKKNIERNSAQKIQAFPYAISGKSEEREMHIKEGHSGAGTLREEAIPESKFGRSIRIVTVDKSFLDSNIQVQSTAKIAVKIDTEGHEAQVLQELMSSKLWGNVFNIFYEVDERYIDNVEILDRLKADGFEVIYQNGSKPHYDLMLEKRIN